MRHRGPDGEGVCTIDEHEIVLEHVRLAIIDPDNAEADQPFTDPTGRWGLVFNGEIFNFRELRAGLERRGVRFRTDSDTEVVLQSFIADGEAAFSTFRGMFAFVSADRETGDLVAARDQLGVKPLYWSLRDGLFLAASELRTVLAYPAARPRLDHTGVIRCLAFGHTGGERTLVEGCSRCRPDMVCACAAGAVSSSNTGTWCRRSARRRTPPGPTCSRSSTRRWQPRW